MAIPQSGSSPTSSIAPNHHSLVVKAYFKKCALTQNTQKSWNIVGPNGILSPAVVDCLVLFLYSAYFQRTIRENVESLVQLQYGDQRRRSFDTLEPKILNSKITCGFAVKHDCLVHRSCQIAWNFDKTRWLCKEKNIVLTRRWRKLCLCRYSCWAQVAHVTRIC